MNNVVLFIRCLLVYHSVFHMFFITKIFQRQMKKNIVHFYSDVIFNSIIYRKDNCRLMIYINIIFPAYRSNYIPIFCSIRYHSKFVF